jgi:hypothetical protein
LLHLGQLDERLAAHLDGVTVAGRLGPSWLMRRGIAGIGEIFVAAVCAIEGGQSARLDQLLSLVEAIPEARSGLTSALGWSRRSP